MKLPEINNLREMLLQLIGLCIGMLFLGWILKVDSSKQLFYFLVCMGLCILLIFVSRSKKK